MSRRNKTNNFENLTLKEKQALAAQAQFKSHLSNNPQKSEYTNSNEERCGFAYHYSEHPLGRLFQNTKNKVIETTIDQVWKNFLRYKCAGNKEKFRQALKDPSIAFDFGTGYVAHLHKLAYKIIETNYTDDDWKRKQGIMKKLADIYCTGIHEDVAYRPRSKLDILMLVEDVLKNPEKYQLTEDEKKNVMMWNGYKEKRENGVPWGYDFYNPSLMAKYKEEGKI